MFDLDVNELCSGLFSDVMDKMGYRHQIIVNMKKNSDSISFLGRARTILIETCETDNENIREGLGFLGTLSKGDILVVKGSSKFAYFGELMTKLSTQMGIEGVVIDGLTRDTNYTHKKDVKLPIVAKGYSPIDIKGRGRVDSTDVKISVDGIDIFPGDLMYVDNEAVCIIPQNIEREVIDKVKEKIEDERRITELIKSGISVSDLLEQVVEF